MSSKSDSVIDQYLNAATQGDVEKIVELTHPDCVISEPASLPYGGEYTGKDAFRELLTDVVRTWETFDFEVGDTVTEDGTTLIIFDLYVENESGESTQTQVAELYRIEDDLIASLDVFYADTAALLELLE